jgi:hypothetical protein
MPGIPSMAGMDGADCLSGSPNSSWLARARGRSAFGASLSASRNLHSGIKAQMCLFAESRLAPRTID